MNLELILRYNFSQVMDYGFTHSIFKMKISLDKLESSLQKFHFIMYVLF